MRTLHGWKSGLGGAAVLTIGVVVAALTATSFVPFHDGHSQVNAPGRAGRVALGGGYSASSRIVGGASHTGRAVVTPRRRAAQRRVGRTPSRGHSRSPVRERRGGAPSPQAPATRSPRSGSPVNGPPGDSAAPGTGSPPGGQNHGGGTPQTPASLGGAVRSTSEQLGNTVNGATEAVGNTVGAVSPALGDTVGQSGPVLQNAVKDTGDALGNTVDGLLGGRR